MEEAYGLDLVAKDKHPLWVPEVCARFLDALQVLEELGRLLMIGAHLNTLDQVVDELGLRYEP